MCSLLMSVFIVGAIESSPGVMTVNYMDLDQISMTYIPVIETMLIPTKKYLSCWENLS